MANSIINQETKGLRVERPTFDTGTLPREIQDRGYLRVGISMALPGFAMRDPATGEASGLEVELGRALARHIFGGSAPEVIDRVEFIDISMSERVPVLEYREVDAVIANFADTPARRKNVDFAGHYLSSSHVPLITNDAPDIKGPLDFAGRRVAVVDGTTDYETIAPIVPDVDVISFRSPPECVDAVIAGDVDAYWTTKTAAPGLCARVGYAVKEASFTAGIEKWAVGLAKADHTSASYVDETVRQILRSSELASWLERIFHPQRSEVDVS